MRGYVVVLCFAAALAPLVPAGATITVDGLLNDWGTWSSDAGGPRFDATTGDTWAVSDWDAGTADNAGNDTSSADKIAGMGLKVHDTFHNQYVRAGGEWYDIEGLYLKLTFDTLDENKLTGIDYALLTSYNGQVPPGSTFLAEPGYSNRPVIALNLTGAAYYDYAITMASYATATTSSGSELYHVTNPAKTWLNAQNFEDGGFGENSIVNPVDLNSNGKLVTSGSGGRWNSYTETSAQQMDSGLDHNYWKQSKNWVWEGSITGLDIELPPGTFMAHTSMICGNDYITTIGDKGFSIPEPSYGLLLLLGMVPLGVACRKRRR